MSTTVQNVIDRAVDRSGLNYALMASQQAMIALVSSEQRKLYIAAARIDPEYFGVSGTTSVRAHYGDPWNLDTTPGDVAAVATAKVAALAGTPVNPETSVTFAVNDVIHLVNSRWPNLEVAPRAYVRGRQIVAHNNELGSADANMVTQLTLFYSHLPSTLSASGATLELPDEWTQLLVLPLARMLALRDKREEEVQIIDGEYSSLYGTFVEAVLAYGYGVRRPIQSVPAIPTSSAKG